MGSIFKAPKMPPPPPIQAPPEPDFSAEDEARKLQGFPEGFIIPVSDGQAYKQFGNAVPVPVIRAIAERMVKHI